MPVHSITSALLQAPIPEATPVLRWSFVALTVGLVVIMAAGVHHVGLRMGAPKFLARALVAVAVLIAGAWMALTGTLAARGALHFQSPPTMLVLMVVTFAGAIGVATMKQTGVFKALIPMWALVGFQGFRVIVEALMHRAWLEGLMPVQMSWSGRNFDVVSGMTAIVVGAWLATGPRSPRVARYVVFAWNMLGVALLANILIIALLSAPTPFRMYMNEPSNVWITHAPWVWLPTIMVPAAIVGHVLVFRRLLWESKDPLANATPTGR